MTLLRVGSLKCSLKTVSAAGGLLISFSHAYRAHTAQTGLDMQPDSLRSVKTPVHVPDAVLADECRPSSVVLSDSHVLGQLLFSTQANYICQIFVQPQAYWTTLQAKFADLAQNSACISDLVSHMGRGTKLNSWYISAGSPEFCYVE